MVPGGEKIVGRRLRTSILASTRTMRVLAPFQKKLENERGLFLSAGCSLRTGKGLHQYIAKEVSY